MGQTATGPRPAPTAPSTTGDVRGRGAREPYGSAAPRKRRGWKRALAWALRLVFVTATAWAMFLPYPYQTGGPFRFLPAKRAEVRSEVEGLVDKVLVREGQWVEQGQAIATISPRTHQKNLKAAQAKLDEAKAELQLLKAGPKREEVERAKADVRTAETSLAWSGPRADRFAKLYSQKLVSDQEYENALRQRDIDKAMLNEAKANLKFVASGARPEQLKAVEAEIRSLQALVDNYRTDVQRTTLKSPIAGFVITPRVEELAGTYLKPGQRDMVVQIEDARTIRAEVEVPEGDAGAVSVGAVVKVVPWAFHDVTFHGTVVSIAPVAAANSADSNTATVLGPAQGATQVAMSGSSERVVRAITEIPNPDGVLKTDMTGFAKIATGDRPVWDVLFRPIIRWVKVEVWYWIP
jgi:putative peptide zinc metalloprotease protein